MAFGWAGAAAGAGDALTQFLAQKRAAFLQDQELRMREEAAKRAQEQFDQTMAMRQQEFAANQTEREADRAYRQGQVERQGRLDDVAAGERRQGENVRGVRRMIGDFLVQRGSQPLDAGTRQTVQGMALQEGIDLPSSVTTDPDKAQNDRLALSKEEHQQRLAEIAAQGQNALRVAGVRAAQSSGAQGRGVLSGDANRIAELRTSLDDLKTLRDTIAKPGETGGTGTGAKIGAMLPNAVTDLTGIGRSAKQKQSVIDRVKQVIGKALEGGVLRKEDEYKYTRILPTIGDDDAVALTKLNGLQTAIKQRLDQQIEALDQAGYNVSGFKGQGAGTGGGNDMDALLDELLGGGR